VLFLNTTVYQKKQGSLEKWLILRFINKCFKTTLLNPFWAAWESADTSQLFLGSTITSKQKPILNNTHNIL
jgi:hypothetical protein